MMGHLTKDQLLTCKEKLIQAKADILNRVRENYKNYQSRDKGGDETDQAVDMQAEGEFLTTQEMLQTRLLEIEIALGKIALGRYGYCEETEEPIEVARLFAIPWTKLSVEGAEIREDLTKRFAK